MSISDFYYKIYRYVAPENLPASLTLSPKNIIFPQQLDRNLPKKPPKIVYGERVQSVYCDRYEGGEFHEPIIKVDYQFFRDESGFVQQKQRTISWMLESGEWSSNTKADLIPIAGELAQLAEIKRRRSNIVDELKSLAKKYSTEQIPLTDKIREVFEANQVLINSYIDAGSPQFRDAIASSKESWLDVVVPATGNSSREVLLDYLLIGQF